MSTIPEVRAVPATMRATRKEAVAASAQRLPQAYAAEQYRVLSHIVQQVGKIGKRLIAISSPVAGDGKTTTSINLAATLAQSSGSRVLLVDADLRRGSLGEQLGFGRPAGPGLAGALASPCSLESVLRRRPGLGFAVLPSGTCPPMPYESLRSARMGEILAEAREQFDHVLLDTPPVVPVADLRGLSDWIDGIFIVVSAHGTPRGLLDEALSSMDSSKVLGLVYNGDDLPLSRQYRSYYSYGDPEPRRAPLILGQANRS
jgi:polysaccharide biosynthesis transport protein